jgi:hypothetical protein
MQISAAPSAQNNLSGTWRWLASTITNVLPNAYATGVAIRIA